MGSIYGQRTVKKRPTHYYYKPNTTPKKAEVSPKHPKQEEENLQLRVANYIRTHYPDVIFISDSGAGADLSDTKRKMMRAMRSDDGMPDISIDQPSRGYHGLRLELKREGTKIYKKDGKTLRKQPYTRKYKKNGQYFIKRGDHLAEQAAMIQKYRAKGYWACFAVGYNDATNKIDRYLNRQQSLLEQALF